MVEWSNTGEQTAWRWFESRPAGLADHRLSRWVPEPFFVLDPGSNPSNHKLLSPPPHPPPKNGIKFQGDRGLKIKKSSGGLFCWAKS